MSPTHPSGIGQLAAQVHKHMYACLLCTRYSVLIVARLLGVVTSGACQKAVLDMWPSGGVLDMLQVVTTSMQGATQRTTRVTQLQVH
jgi:hypothetical protein